jgi:fructokinase
MTARCRIGIDLGGTKISAIAFDDADVVVAMDRRETPKGDYAATIAIIVDMVGALEQQTSASGSVGIGIPGSVSPLSGRIQNANSIWLNGMPFPLDLENALARPVRLANDANCFALSETHDGTARGAASVFGVIIGTGCGGGIVMDGEIRSGAQRIAGEWGHTPLPWQTPDEHPGRRCWCGRHGCLETWVSGPGLARDHGEVTGETLDAVGIAAKALNGNPSAQATLDRHADRLARGLAMVVNILDPEVIVLGGGLSSLNHLYKVLPDLMRPHIFADAAQINVLPPRHGDDSGVRGAARLW